MIKETEADKKAKNIRKNEQMAEPLKPELVEDTDRIGNLLCHERLKKDGNWKIFLKCFASAVSIWKRLKTAIMSNCRRCLILPALLIRTLNIWG